MPCGLSIMEQPGTHRKSTGNLGSQLKDKIKGRNKMSTLVHSRGEGVKFGLNLVHVVVEWPLSSHFPFEGRRF